LGFGFLLFALILWLRGEFPRAETAIAGYFSKKLAYQ
jgi:hypothetical protein